jgi:hypothetical protein
MSILEKLFKNKPTAAASASGLDPQMRANNTALQAAMSAVAKSDSPETRRVLYEAMQNAWFLVPRLDLATPVPASGKGLPDSAPLRMPIIENADGNKIVPAFTDEAALNHWHGAPIQYFALQGVSFFRTVLKSGADEIGVNAPPVGKPPIRAGGCILRSEFQVLAEGRIPQPPGAGGPVQLKLAQDQTYLLCMPTQMPRQELFDVLSSAARTQPNIRALYFCQILIGEAAPHMAIAIDLLPGTAQLFIDKIISVLGTAIQPLLAQNDLLDFFPSTVTPLADSIKKQGVRVYVASAS